MTPDAPKNPFSYHKPDDSLIPKIEEVREAYKALYAVIGLALPDSRYKSLAITEAESSMQWAIKSIIMNS